MSAPTFVVDESNGAGQTVTTNVGQTAYASTDTASTSSLSANNPVVQGTNSYEKWQRVHVTGAAPSAIDSLSVYYPGTAVEDNSSSSAHINLLFATNHAYATPTASTSSIATTNANTVTTAPGTSVTAPANTIGALSGYVIEQLQTDGSVAGGPCIFASPYRAFSVTWQ